MSSCDCDRFGLSRQDECIHPESCDSRTGLRPGAIQVGLSAQDAQALYDLMGVLPWDPEAYPTRVRQALSDALGGLNALG